MSKMRVEVWMGGLDMPAYTVHDPQRIDMSVDSTTVRIIDNKGWTLETSPHNVVIVSEPEDEE